LDIAVLDPTAGGGSIPFESARLGLQTFGNDLNPVASLIDRATVHMPVELGVALRSECERIAARFVAMREKRIPMRLPPSCDGSDHGHAQHPAADTTEVRRGRSAALAAKPTRA
jgi:hypothetical protein